MPVMRQRGFSLIEVLVGLGIFLIFTVGIYSTINLVFKLVFQSRIRIVEAAILNEQIELVRNLQFNDVGIVSSTPAGILPKTTQVVRNNISFTVTRTVRNVDDPFDGTLTSVPADTSPTDYKFVEISVQCDTCSQNAPMFMATNIAATYLESSENTGALTVRVFDASARPVSGATVQIFSTSTSPAVNMLESTDINGEVNVVGLAPGQSAYHITVQKNGYTSDSTIISTPSNPHPLLSPTSITAGQVATASFFIDESASFTLISSDEVCNPVAQTPFTITGARLIGTDPDVYRVDTTVQTNGLGQYVSSSFGWDTYVFQSAAYDIIGTIPALPMTVAPGAVESVQLILGPNTARSLLVNVRDRVTGQPISKATVVVTSTIYNEEKTTGIGHIRQTSWQGGGGQVVAQDLEKYFTDDGSVSVDAPVDDLTLRMSNGEYVASGYLESSTFDLGTPVNFVRLYLEPLAQLPEVGINSVRVQLATSDSSTTTAWNYRGFDGTGTTYYDTEHLDIHDVNDGNRYARYKVFLQTSSVTTTPVLSDIALSYTTACTPPGQAHFDGLAADTYTVSITVPGYSSVVEQIPITGDVYTVIDMTPSE